MSLSLLKGNSASRRVLSLFRRRRKHRQLFWLEGDGNRAIANRRSYHEVSFVDNGEPSDVLSYYYQQQHDSAADEGLGRPEDGNNNFDDYIKVQMLAAPWNPADVNTVQGRYPSPVKNPFPQWPSVRGSAWKVAGSEGLGRIIGSSGGQNDNKQYHHAASTGKLVAFGGMSGMGTLRSSLWVPKHAVIPIDRGNELLDKIGGTATTAASTLFQLGGTAWKMLEDFETLNEGSVVVQNAGNSGVGYMVSQLASQRNIHVISLVRRGHRTSQQFQQLVASLTEQSTNTTRVVAEEDLLQNKNALKELLQSHLPGKHPPPRLALNAVGGDSAGILMKLLAPGGTMVTYGGLSMLPIRVATPQLIFKDLKLQGYWHSRWMARSFPQQRKRLIDDLVNAVLQPNNGISCPPIEVFQLSEIQEALEFDRNQSSSAAIRKKVVLDCRETI